MSHWGPTHGEIMGAERHRKSLQTSAQDLLVAVIDAIRNAGQRQYRSLGEILEASPSSHAEDLRKSIEARVISAAYQLNVEIENKESN